MTNFIKKNYTQRHNNGLPPIHPGLILREEFLRPIFPDNNSPLGFDVHAVAARTGIHASHLKPLLQGQVNLTAEDAFHLARYFGTLVDLWLGLQEAYDVKMFEVSSAFKAIEEIKPHQKKDGVLVPLTTSELLENPCPHLRRATNLIREAQDLISTNDPGQRLIGQLEAFLKDMGVKTIDETVKEP